MKALAHILDCETGEMITKGYMAFVPSIGELLRISEDSYYNVELVCWVLDEPECPYARVNIGVTKIKEPK